MTAIYHLNFGSDIFLRLRDYTVVRTWVIHGVEHQLVTEKDQAESSVTSNAIGDVVEESFDLDIAVLKNFKFRTIHFLFFTDGGGRHGRLIFRRRAGVGGGLGGLHGRQNEKGERREAGGGRREADDDQRGEKGPERPLLRL